MSNSLLINKYVPAYEGNFTYGRQGNGINKIVIHHAAGSNLDSIGSTFQTVGRNGSAHYGLKNGSIHQYIDEANTAWHCGNWQGNLTSVGIEVANEYFNGNWNDLSNGNFTISEESFNTLVRLVADIAKRNGLGNLVYGQNLFGHRDMAPGTTSCPLHLYPRLTELCNRANALNVAIIETPKVTITDITNKKVVLNKDANLWNLDFNTYAEAKIIKSFKKGETIEVSATAKHSIGSTYYLTEYSYSNKINNGFNVADCDDYVEPVIETPIIIETPIEEEPIVEEPTIETPIVEDPKVETPVGDKGDDTITTDITKEDNLISLFFSIIGNIIKEFINKIFNGGK